MHKNRLGIGPTHSCMPERSQSHSCTHSNMVLEAYRPTAAVISKLLQIKCINATSYELHVNVFNIMYADYFFIKSTFFSPLMDTLPAILLHQPSKCQAIFDASDWLIVHSEKEWNLGHSTREWNSLEIGSDQLNVFSALPELKSTQLELNKSHPKLEWIFTLLHLESKWW